MLFERIDIMHTCIIWSPRVLVSFGIQYVVVWACFPRPALVHWPHHDDFFFGFRFFNFNFLPFFWFPTPYFSNSFTLFTEVGNRGAISDFSQLTTKRHFSFPVPILVGPFQATAFRRQGHLQMAVELLWAGVERVQHMDNDCIYDMHMCGFDQIFFHLQKHWYYLIHAVDSF